VSRGKEPRRRLVITLKGVNDYRWVVNIMSSIGATNYTQAIRAALFIANRLIELGVNPMSAVDYVKEYRKNISKLQTELAKVIEMLNGIPKNQQVININGETVNIGTLADKIENITNMIKQLNETLTVKQNI